MSDPAAALARHRRRRLPPLAIALGAGYIAIGGVVAVLLPLQVERIDPAGKVGTLALVSSVSFAATLFAQPLLGALSDRTRARFGGRLPWLVGGAVIGAAAVAGMGWATSIAALCVLWALGQFALNGVDISVSASLVDEFPRERRGGAAGVFAGGVAIGTGIGAVLGGTLAAVPPLAFGVVAVLAVAGSLVLVLAGRRIPYLPIAPVRDRASWRDRLAIHREPDFLRGVASRFAFGIGQQSVSVFLLYIVTDHIGVAEGAAPLLVSALTATALVGLVLGAVVSGPLSDRFGRRPLLIGSSVLFAIAMIIPIVAPTLGAMFVLAAIQGIALGSHLAVVTALLSEVLPGGDDHAGRDLGLVNIVVNAAQVLAPVLAAAIVVTTGGYEALFAFAIAAGLLSAVLVIRVRSVR